MTTSHSHLMHLLTCDTILTWNTQICVCVKKRNANSKFWLLSCMRVCWTPLIGWSVKSLSVCRKETQRMLLSKKIKLEVSEQDAATLEFMQEKCRGLYNWWVMRLRAGERWPGVYEAKKSLQASKLHDS